MSLKSRRKLLLHIKHCGLDEPEMISVLPIDTNAIPFPYSSQPYAFSLQNKIKSSDYPFYIYKRTERDYALVSTDVSVIGSWAAEPITADTSELGDVTYYMDKWSSDRGNFGVCNYPIQEVRYSDDGTKLFIVRE